MAQRKPRKGKKQKRKKSTCKKKGYGVGTLASAVISSAIDAGIAARKDPGLARNP